MKELLSSLLEMDLSGILPEMGSFVGWTKAFVAFAMLIGPLIMVICGLLYLKKPEPRATYKRGYRTRYGMGSTEAWRYTQRLAGFVWTAVGGGLLAISLIVMLIALLRSPMVLVVAAAILMLIQLPLVSAVTVYIFVTVRKNYDKDGNRRK